MKKNPATSKKTAKEGAAPRHYAKKTGSSTREIILQKANEIINQTGVVDFRIEALATALSLSPGNITYHFPKKEDIISSIWEKYVKEMEVLCSETVTPLLDIKQMFLMCRSLSIKTLAYVGVAAHYYGDIGALTRDNDFYRNRFYTIRELMMESYGLLIRNGYMVPIKDKIIEELTIEAQFVPLRWWLNHAMIKGNLDSLQGKLDSYMAMSIYPLTPYLTAEGKSQMDSILNVLNQA